MVIWEQTMSTYSVSLAEAKAHLSELTNRVSRGSTVVITKRGKPVAQVTKPETIRKPIELAKLRGLTDSMPRQSQDAGEFMRGQREDARY